MVLIIVLRYLKVFEYVSVYIYIMAFAIGQHILKL